MKLKTKMRIQKMRKNFFCIALFISCVALPAAAESSKDALNPLLTGAPSLSITPDARGGSMGDIGAATTPDINSQHWNPAKYPFIESNMGLAVSYTPWLSAIVNDIDLGYLSYYYKFDDLQAISTSFRYFSLGNIPLTTANEEYLGDAQPFELAVDVAYSRKLSEHFSAAVAFRFIYSDLNNGINTSAGGSSTEMYPGWSLAADVAAYYTLPITLSTGDANLAFGLNISNLGSKISYDQRTTSNFIPTNLRLGASFDIPFDDYNRLSINADLNKLMVPTSQSRFAEGFDPNDDTTWDLGEAYYDISPMRGLWMSFCDAPGGFKEELREIAWGAGLEYAYNKQFFVRAGYFNEHETKGNRRYFTVGAGFKLSAFSLDAGYVIALHQTNPLDRTLRFTLAFDIFGLRNLVK